MAYLWIALFYFICPIYAAPKPHVEPELDIEPWCEGKPADIFFLLDTSSSIQNAEFEKQKEFVQELVNVFDLSSSKTRIAISTFSSYYQSMIEFGQCSDKVNITKAIGEIRHRGGNTNTGDAIQEMAETFASSARREVAHIAFILTDGRSQEGDKTEAEAKKAKKAGIYIYAIGIGNRVDPHELLAIGSVPSDDFVYTVPSFDLLHTLKEQLAAKACSIQNDGPACGSDAMTDLMFSFDSSAMGAAKSRQIYRFISNVSEHLVSNSEGNIQTGVLSRHCPHNDITLNMYDNKHQLIEELNNPILHGMEHLVKELRLKSFQEVNGGRDAANHAAVLFIDNETEHLERVLQQSKYTQFNNVTLFVVNIGDGNDKELLEGIASKPIGKHMWNIKSCDNLEEIKMNIIEAFC